MVKYQKIGIAFFSFCAIFLIFDNVKEYPEHKRDVQENIPVHFFDNELKESVEEETSKHRLVSIQIQSGATLKTIFKDLNIDEAQALDMTMAFCQVVSAKSLKSGQTIDVHYDDQKSISKMVFYTKSGDHIILEKKGDSFIASREIVRLKKVLKKFKGSIDSSFYQTAHHLGVPSKIIKESVQTLSYSVNFQHGIKYGDNFEIIFDAYENDQGRILKTGDIHYVSLGSHRFYRFNQQYYNDHGESVVRTLLQTPLEASCLKVTSKFSSGRFHPIKKYTRAHKGVDFGARTGTPIKAAGHGVIVKIKHGSGYQTLYAHMSKFAQNLHVGSKVKQGQLIGYVGSTGLASGPHLHYEVILNNCHVDPQKVKMLPAGHLSGRQKKMFDHNKRRFATL
jgi:murein DD-endopeptidase MepM/ murein hydrolase activator NlpD